LMAERKHRSDGIYFDQSVLPVTEPNLLDSQAYPKDAAVDQPSRRSGSASSSLGAMTTRRSEL
jgi:hypothetical protein